MDSEDNVVFDTLPETLLFDLALRYRVQNLDITLAGKNLGNERVLFAQPFDGFHAPLPGRARSIMLRLAYHVPM